MDTKREFREWISEVLGGIYKIILGGFLLVILLFFLKNSNSFIIKAFIIPVVLGDILAIIREIIATIIRIKNKDSLSNENKFDTNEKLNTIDRIFLKIYLTIFLLFWFGFLIVIDYISIKQENYSILAFSSVFWFVGICIGINNFKR